MLAAIDHVIIACRDPDAAAAEIESTLGLRATGGGRHDAHGTFNRLIWLGDSYIELMGIFEWPLAAESWWGRHIAGLLAERPSALAGLALATDDLEADIAVLRAQASPISDPLDGQRVRPDGRVVKWQIGRLPEVDPDLGLVFLIEHDTSAAEWTPAERQSRAGELHPTGTPARLARVEFPIVTTAQGTQRLHRELGLAFRPSLAGGGARDSSVGRQTLRLMPRGGLPTVAISAGHESVVTELLGCRWLVEPYRSRNAEGMGPTRDL